jgi:hypothetical protein
MCIPTYVHVHSNSQAVRVVRINYCEQTKRARPGICTCTVHAYVTNSIMCVIFHNSKAGHKSNEIWHPTEITSYTVGYACTLNSPAVTVMHLETVTGVPSRAHAVACQNAVTEMMA